MKITLPDGSVREYEGEFVTPRQVAESISAGLARAAVGARVDGELTDLGRPIEHDARLELLTRPRKGTPLDEQDPDALYLLRHSCAHVMAEAIQRIYGESEALLAYGPPLENGFYYDIKLDTPISSDDFDKIEAEMARIIKEDRPFVRYELVKDDGLARLEREGNRYKIDNARRAIDGGAQLLSWYVTGYPSIRSFPDENRDYFEIESAQPLESGSAPARDYVPREELRGNVIPTDRRRAPREKDKNSRGSTLVSKSNWEDLCQGPHVPSTGAIGAFKLMSVASSHWHGDINSDRFQRVYGTAFFSKADLQDYLDRLEEARKRDHRVIGQKLNLFTIDEKVGQGLVLWKPRGAMVRNLLEDFLKQKLLDSGYELVYTPHIGKIDLYKTSGHYPYYSDSQFPPIKMRDSDEEYLLKPMNCPHHCRIYESQPRSYRDLPVRLAEFGTVYRFEQSGELTGMTRVRGFTQDDAHVFCTPDQVKDEVRSCVELVQFVFNSLGFENVDVFLSLRDPQADKYVGDPRDWDRAERELRELLDEMGLDYVTEEGEAAFYGPKIDFKVRDVIGRSWQLGTVQLDYNLPKRFELKYIGADNQPHQPVMIHRAPFGSMERFMGILIEHYAGAFPLWLSPEQVRVMPISEKFMDYAQKVFSAVRQAGLRATLDDSNERVNAKIKVGQDDKVNYMLVVGGRDEQSGTVSVRDRSRGDLGALPLEQFIEQVKGEAASHGQQVVEAPAEHSAQ